MPIKPENLARYPKNWKKEIRPAILLRAEYKCEGSPKFPDCRRPNGALLNKRTGEITTDGQIAEVWELVDGDDVTKIVLTIAHLDHTPENCAPENLRAWCQRCHLVYDAAHHAKNARITRMKKLANRDLFEGASA
jgi:hypothetical protein